MSDRKRYINLVREQDSPNKYTQPYNKFSTATAYSSMPEEREDTISQKRKKIRRKRKKFVIKHKEDDQLGISALFVLSAVILFTGLMVFVSSYAINKEAQVQIIKLNTALQKIEEENRLLQAEISANYDLATIEKIATTKLGMSKPKPYQIVYINVPVQGSVIQHRRNVENTAPTGIWGKVNELLIRFGITR